MAGATETPGGPTQANPVVEANFTGREFYEILECLMLGRRADPSYWAQNSFLQHNLTLIASFGPQMAQAPDASAPWNLSKEEAVAWLHLLAMPSDGELESNPAVRPTLQAKLEAALANMMGAGGSASGRPRGCDWADIETIRAEWPVDELNATADLASWQSGIRLYQSDDYTSMMRCAETLSPALAHSLYGKDLLQGADLPETVHKIIYASLTAPPDGKTFAEVAQKATRLALTITRERGWQPAECGGQGLFDHFFNDQGNSMLMMAAIASPGQMAGDLNAFFSVPLTPSAAGSEDPPT